MRKYAVFAFAFVAVSCGYHVGDSRSPESTLHVFVPVFENLSVRPMDLNKLTSQLRESLEVVRGVKIVNDRANADLLVLVRVNKYDRTWGPTAYKGTIDTQASGGLKENALSASTARLTLGLEIEKRAPDGRKLWSAEFSESDLYELSDRLTLVRGSAAAPQMHTSREEILVGKLADRIFERARAQIVDDF